MTHPDAQDVKLKAHELKDKLVEGAKEFKDEEVKSAGGTKAFIAGGVGGICTVLVGTSFSPSSLPPPGLPQPSSCRESRELTQSCSRFPRTGHPFDLTKTRLQTAAPGSYTGAIDVVKKTLARDGVRGCVLPPKPPLPPPY